jgi:hypothetical protein
MFLYSDENQIFISTFQVNYEKYAWLYEFKSILYSDEDQIFIPTFQVNYEKYAWLYEFKPC